MSCDHRPAVHRTIDLPAAPEEVWDAVVGGAWLGDGVEFDARPGGAVRVDGKVGVVESVEPGRSLSLLWSGVEEDERSSRVDLELLRVGDVTRLWVREVRLDHDVPLARSPLALARV